ncbi:hypothetical protein [Priestia aryabhattai]|uniref:hypothetical protein n=1 Tax=Priestia aryabhattai TaxID=412384 RepID=UPI001C8E5415|nr:hypothetical protein [Priestia aryabhattai]MBX9986357.1 hypothetical protein [Priestia aryabhattai]MBY0001974.1 hypothetical protein [Priestia aryabhattai]
MYINLTSQTEQQRVYAELAEKGKSYFTYNAQEYYASVQAITFPNKPGQNFYYTHVAIQNLLKSVKQTILGVCPHGAAVASRPFDDFDKSGKFIIVFSDKVKEIPYSLLKDQTKWTKENV